MPFKINPCGTKSAFEGICNSKTCKEESSYQSNADCNNSQPGDITHEADYIVVGAGAAGCVAAARLAEAGFSVILLEAGPDNSFNSTDTTTQPDINIIKTPIQFTQLYNRYRIINPSAPCSQKWYGTSTLLDFVSVNQKPHENTPDMPEVYYPYPRGGGAGGSSNHNAMQDGVGTLKIYDILASETGDPYWQGNNMDRLFKKMENLSNIPSGPDSPNPGPDYAGQNGWLKIAVVKQEKIHTDMMTIAHDMFGVPIRTNFKNQANVSGIGPSYVQITPEGNRSYGYQDLLKPVMEQTGLVKVFFNHLSTNLILENDGKSENVRCVGVKAYDKAYIQNITYGNSTFFQEPLSGKCFAIPSDRTKPNKKVKFFARNEVIVCGGAIQSPQLLMLSGIGPKTHLESLGIKCMVDLPGVGTNLTDHCEFSVIYELNPEKYLPGYQAQILYDLNEAAGGNVLPPAIKDVCENLKDPSEFSSNTGAIVFDWHSGFDTPDQQFPDTHSVPYLAPIWGFDYDNYTGNDILEECGDPGTHLRHFRRDWMPDSTNPMSPNPGPTKKSDLTSSLFNLQNPRVFISWLVETLKPGTANGTVRLRSNDPCEEPILDERLYEDDTGLERIALQIQKIRDIMNHSTIVNNYLLPGDNAEITPGKGAVTPEDIKKVIKNWSAFGHHISGTCQMGPPNDNNAVVDSKLRVRKVKNLRVADTSVYRAPNLHAFNTVRAAYLMGEVVAERIINKD